MLMRVLLLAFLMATAPAARAADVALRPGGCDAAAGKALAKFPTAANCANAKSYLESIKSAAAWSVVSAALKGTFRASALDKAAILQFNSKITP